jgi:hypothetical protein
VECQLSGGISICWDAQTWNSNWLGGLQHIRGQLKNDIKAPGSYNSPCFFKSLQSKSRWSPISFDSRKNTATISNTLLVDDCPYKYVCYPNECRSFPNPFTNGKDEEAYMTKVFPPFFKSMLYSPMSDQCFFSKEMGLYIGSWPIHWLASLAI